MQESTRHTTLKKVLFILVASLLFLPMIQQQLVNLKSSGLHGSYSTLERPTFSFNNWLDGTYQKEQQEFLDQNIGFKKFFIQVYNQICYTLYNEARANGVIIGKENYLYEENYIKAYFGTDFIGRNQVAEKISKLQKIKDTLRTTGIDLIVVFAPGKGSFYPEFFPEKYDTLSRSTTNYEVYKEKLEQSEIPFLNFHQWFSEMKSVSPYPLFPKTGIHWSKYGEVLAADSIIKYINSRQNEKKVPQLVIDNIEVSRKTRDTDDDIEKGMNLLINIKDLEMGYPQFKILKDSTANPPKVLAVADSYYWGMFNWGLSRDAFKNGQFWFYNRQIYPDSFEEPIDVQDINIVEEVQKNDVILLITTDANLHTFAFGFIDQLYDGYFNSNSGTVEKNREKEARIQFYITSIKENIDWIDPIKKQAQEDHISVEEAIRKNAEYMVWKESNGTTISH